MKKTTLILAGIALIAASCAKTEVVSSGPDGAEKGISFSAYTARPTKAQEDVTTDNLTSFQATAIGNSAIYFDNVTFTKGESASYWESNPAYFWPAYSLNFCAYNTPTLGNRTFTRNFLAQSQTITFSPSTNLSEQEDLVAAYAENQNQTESGATSLTFNHYLTQVVVNAKCSNTGYTVVVDGVKLANLAGEGTYTFRTNSMAATAEKVNSASSSDYSSIFTAKTLNSSAVEVMADATGKWYLVPQTVAAWKRNSSESAESATNQMKNSSNGTYLALKVKITTAGGSKVYPVRGEESAWMAVPVPPDLAFAQGTKYNVTFDFFSTTGGGAGYVDPEEPGDLDGNISTEDNGKKIIGGAIKFDAEVSGWGNAVDITISL